MISGFSVTSAIVDLENASRHQEPRVSVAALGRDKTIRRTKVGGGHQTFRARDLAREFGRFKVEDKRRQGLDFVGQGAADRKIHSPTFECCHATRIRRLVAGGFKRFAAKFRYARQNGFLASI
jgi:hypothetical protein